MKAEQIVHLFDTYLVNHSHCSDCSTGLFGAVVKLSDLRLIGTEIESRSRNRIFNLSIGSNPQ